jgi:hypothetical protein
MLDDLIQRVEIDGIGPLHFSGPESRRKAAAETKAYVKAQPVSSRGDTVSELLRRLAVTIPPDIGRSYTLSWSDIREMAKNRIDFGAHTMTHPRLSELGARDAAFEIAESKHMIERRLGAEVFSFAYPYGSSKDFNDETVSLVKDAGFGCAVSFRHGLVNRPVKGDHLYMLPRISGSNPATFEFGISGLSTDLMSGARRNAGRHGEDARADS